LEEVAASSDWHAVGTAARVLHSQPHSLGDMPGRSAGDTRLAPSPPSSHCTISSCVNVVVFSFTHVTNFACDSIMSDNIGIRDWEYFLDFRCYCAALMN